MTTVLDTLQKGTEYLSKHGVDEARLNMQHLMAHALNCNRTQLYLDFDRPLDEPVLESLRALVKRRALGEPLQHLLGTVEFYGREFACDGRALIPRPETEQLVEFIIKKATPPEGARILDMGTGCGVIGLSLMAEWQDRIREAVLADISEDALALAEANRSALQLDEGRCRLLKSDLFETVSDSFDVLAANLPYIAAAEVPELSREVRADPHTALDGGRTGVELMERFIAGAAGHAEPGALLAMEFGAGQTEPLRQAAAAAGWTDVEFVKDYPGHDRFLFAHWPAASPAHS